MGRIILLLLIGVFALVVFVGKMAVGAVSNNKSMKSSTLKQETKTAMNGAAKGLNWMEKQWEKSKQEAEKNDKLD